MICAKCSAELAAEALKCPECQTLVHAEELQRLAGSAAGLVAKKEYREALEAWQKALPLLPEDSRQHQLVADKIGELTPLATAQDQEKAGLAKWVAALGPVGLVLWKFKFAALFVLTKAKLLILGLTKLTTLSTMLLSLGLYWKLYGWWFALGIVISIYIHEMGHVSELRRFGIPASAPMFIPGLGAVVQLRARPATVGQDARVGLAGPVWGTATAVACYGVYLATGNEFWSAMARWGAWINLFNLVPVWQLDGGRAFRALTRRERALAILPIVTMWIWTEDMVLFFLAAGAVWRLFSQDFPEEGDGRVLVKYWLLVMVLGMLCLIPALK